MIAQTKSNTQTDLKTIIDIILINLGMLAGGLIALIALWLWFDYQADPLHSYLAFISHQLAATMPAWLREAFGGQAQLMGLPLANKTSAYWYMARAGGIVAYLLLWLSTIYGLMLSSKLTTNLISAPIAYGLHEFLSILAVVFALIHAAVLLGDEYIKFNLVHLAIPFVAPYKPLWTGLGTIGLYLSLALTGSFYIRKQIGQKVWRSLHYLTFAAYLLALLHGIMAGTDRALPALWLTYLGSGFTVLFLTYYRLFTLKIRA